MCVARVFRPGLYYLRFYGCCYIYEVFATSSSENLNIYLHIQYYIPFICVHMCTYMIIFYMNVLYSLKSVIFACTKISLLCEWVKHGHCTLIYVYIFFGHESLQRCPWWMPRLTQWYYFKLLWTTPRLCVCLLYIAKFLIYKCI